MKLSFSLVLSLGLAFGPGLRLHAADGTGPTILTVDMKKLFEAHPKTIAEEKRIAEERNKAKIDPPRDERMEKGRRLQAEVVQLDESLKSGKLVGAELESARRQRNEKVDALNVLGDEIRMSQMAREKETQEKSTRLRGEIVEDINKAIAATPALRGITFVLDTSGPSLSGVPVVNYSHTKLDRTDPVLKQLTGKKAVEGPNADAGKGLNIALVDMKRIFAGYKKTKEGTEKINEARRAASKEFADLTSKVQTAVEALKKVELAITEPGLSAAMRKVKEQERVPLAAQMQALDRAAREFQATQEKKFQEQSAKVRKEIVDDIDRVVAEGVKADGRVDLILDASGMSLNGVPFLLRQEGIPDWSDAVIRALNNGPAGGKKSSIERTGGSTSTSELRFAVIDMKRIYKEAGSIKAAQRAIEEAKTKMKSEIAAGADEKAKEKDLQDFSLKKQQEMVAGVTKVLGERAAKAGCHLVFDVSGPSLSGVPVVIGREGVLDLSGEIIAGLGE